MGYRILQAALLVVAASAVVYVVLMVKEGSDAQTPQIVRGLGLPGVPLTYLANELRRTRNRLR